MNLNILTYIIYSLVTGFIILRVGWLFYHFGAVYLHGLFDNNVKMADAINRMLLIGYYLLNLGYVAFSLSQWPAVNTYPQMISLLSEKTGLICILLGLIHFMNMLGIRLLHRQNLKFINP